MSELSISPAPSDEEAAAITAAYEVLWPKPQAAPAADDGHRAWRFSGRWWIRDRRPLRQQAR